MSTQPAAARRFSRLGRGAPAESAPTTDAYAPRAEVSTILAPALIRGCREAMNRLAGTDGMHELGVTSAIRGEGRSSVAAAMAVVSAADHEQRTILVDLDLDRPTQHRRFGIGRVTGISDLKDEKVSVEDHLHQVAKNLWLLSAGRPRGDGPRVLNRLMTSSLLSQIREWADTVVFDLPPLFGSATGQPALRIAAQPVLVVRAGSTQLPQVARAKELFADPPAVILNGMQSSIPRWLLRSLGEWR